MLVKTFRLERFGTSNATWSRVSAENGYGV